MAVAKSSPSPTATAHHAAGNRSVRPPQPAAQWQLTRRELHSALGALLLPAQMWAVGEAAAAAAAVPQAASLPRLTTGQMDQIEQAYDGYAATYDDLDGGAVAEQLGFPALRQQLLQLASGDVLETAVGTGLNLPFYNTPALTSLTAIDLSTGMLSQAQRRAAQLGLVDSIQFLQADVERLQEALDGRTFDTVVDTFSLCVFPDPGLALRSMSACLRPGGRLLLLEHSRSEFAPLGWYQDVTAAAVAATGKGCRWNDNVSQLVQAAGLEVQQSEAHVGGLVVSLVASKKQAAG